MKQQHPSYPVRRFRDACLHAFRLIVSFGMAMVLTVLVFLVLPMMQKMAEPRDRDLEVRTVQTTTLDAPPPPPEPEPEDPEEEEEPPPELAEETQPLDLSQLELALNPGFGGAGGAAEFDVKLLSSMTRKVDEESDALFSLADLDQPPRAVYKAPPQFPPEMRKKGMQGTVYLLFVVNQLGRVVDPRIQKSTHAAFEGPALQAIRRWRFEPGKRNGKPVQFRMRLPITFMQ